MCYELQIKALRKCCLPKKVPHLGAIYESPVYEPGKVVSFDCYRDYDLASKKKFWICDIVYERKDGNIQKK